MAHNPEKVGNKHTKLDESADTKRKLLSTIASVFDPLGIQLPLLIRAKLFVHDLTVRKNSDWDTKLDQERLKTWRNICKQFNAAGQILIPRSVGGLKDKYDLVCYSDSSKRIFGTVLYLRSKTSKKLYFFMAKNHLIPKHKGKKTIPEMELTSILLAAETAREITDDLAGAKSLSGPVIDNVVIFNDSQVALAWLNSFVHLEKQNKRATYVRNVIEKIDQIAEKSPIAIKHIAGVSNPADFVTRATSYNILSGTNYLEGPSDASDSNASGLEDGTIVIKLPRSAEYESAQKTYVNLAAETIKVADPNYESFLPLRKYSEYQMLYRVTIRVIRFVQLLKQKVKDKNPEKYKHLSVSTDYSEATTALIIKEAQAETFPEALYYLKAEQDRKGKIPGIVARMNLYLDDKGMLRVGSKMMRFKEVREYFPILLPKDHHITKLIVWRAHLMRCHSGLWAVLADLKPLFWVIRARATVTKILKQCIHCRRFNNRTIKLNQNSYPEFRVKPSHVPFRNIFIDYAGPFMVTRAKEKVKVYVLVITCIYTRAISLKCTIDLSTDELLRALQLHSFTYEMPSSIRSDLGSQFVAGANILKNLLKTPAVTQFFAERDIRPFEWEHCDKGQSSLASLVESCVKITKRAIAGSIGRNVLSERDFEFMLSQANAIVNKRPIAFKASLSDNPDEPVPEEITPEMLLHGRRLEWTNIIPGLQPVQEEAYNPRATIRKPGQLREDYVKLRACAEKLEKIYNQEMVTQLIEQATDRKDTYKKVHHNLLQVGDIVLMKEENTKPINYPLARVKSIRMNSLGEIVGAEVLKGASREVVRRHTTSLIPLLQRSELTANTKGSQAEGEIISDQRQASDANEAEDNKSRRPQRKAAKLAQRKTREMVQDEIYCNLTLNPEDKDTIISTTCCEIGDGEKGDSTVRVRAVLDSGSQHNIIDQAILATIPHTVEEENHKVELKTILGKQTYDTSVVSIDLRLGPTVRKIIAYVISMEDLHWTLPGLHLVAHEIEKKGYTMADQELKKTEERVRKVQLIIGTYMNAILTGTSVRFGEESSLMMTPEVVLIGKLSALQRDLPALPECPKPPETEGEPIEPETVKRACSSIIIAESAEEEERAIKPLGVKGFYGKLRLRKKTWAKWILLMCLGILGSLLLVPMLSPKGRSKVETQWSRRTANEGKYHRTKLIVDLPSTVYQHLAATTMASAPGMEAYTQRLDEALANWERQETRERNVEDVGNPLASQIAADQPVTNCSASSECLIPFNTKDQGRAKRAIGMINGVVMRVGRVSVRGARRVIGKRTGVPRPASAKTIKLRNRMRLAGKVGKTGVKVTVGIATGYMVYEAAMSSWAYFFEPEFNLDSALESIQNSAIKEAVLAGNLSYASAEETQLLTQLQRYEELRTQEVYGEIEFRSFALYSLMQEQQMSIEAIESLANRQLRVTLSLSDRILKVLDQQINSNSCRYQLSRKLFNDEGYILLEGMDIPQRRVFLELGIPLKLELGLEVANQGRCHPSQREEMVKEIGDEDGLVEKLSDIYQKQDNRRNKNNQALNNWTQSAGALMKKWEETNEMARDALQAARDIQGAPAWLSYSHLMVFLMLLSAAVLWKACRGCQWDCYRLAVRIGKKTEFKEEPRSHAVDGDLGPKAE